MAFRRFEYLAALSRRFSHIKKNPTNLKKEYINSGKRGISSKTEMAFSMRFHVTPLQPPKPHLSTVCQYFNDELVYYFFPFLVFRFTNIQ